MFSKNKLDGLIIFDIETVPVARSYEELPTNLATAFDRCCSYTNKDSELDCNEYFLKQAGLRPEYARIVCFSYGKFHFYEDGDYELETRSYCDDDEKVILKKVDFLLKKTKENAFQVAGHNIIEFDVPLLIKRFIINGMKVPEILWTPGMKPWELPFVDTKTIWKFNSYQVNTSLEEMALILGIDSPKAEMNGGQVYEEFYINHNLEKIKKYCEADVRATAEVLLRMSEIPYEK